MIKTRNYMLGNRGSPARKNGSKLSSAFDPEVIHTGRFLGRRDLNHCKLPTSTRSSAPWNRAMARDSLHTLRTTWIGPWREHARLPDVITARRTSWPTRLKNWQGFCQEVRNCTFRMRCISDNCAVVELPSLATAENGLRFDNLYCWVCRFEDGKKFDSPLAPGDRYFFERLSGSSRKRIPQEISRVEQVIIGRQGPSIGTAWGTRNCPGD